jgi:hypothetical protein
VSPGSGVVENGSLRAMHFAIFPPNSIQPDSDWKCGVPRKMIPTVDVCIVRPLFCKSRIWTIKPPRLWATKMILRSA